MKKCQDFLSFKNAEVEDIPDIDLYMDQVTGYIDTVLDKFKIDENDKILTKTMINNYVKAKVIDQPVKKKYNKDQIMELIMIYHLKNIISISDIDRIYKLAKNQCSETENEIKEEEESSETIYATEDIYKVFLEVQKEVFKEAKIKFEKHTNIDTNTSKEDTIRLILKLVLEADVNKRLAELMFKELME